MKPIKQQLFEAIDNQISNQIRTREVKEIEISIAAEKCEQICDEFAVKFAEWLHKNGYRQSRIDGVYWTNEKISTHHKTDDLILKFKKEVYGE